MTARRFRALVAEVLDSLPRRFAEKLENVVVQVEEEPTAEDLERAGVDPRRGTLFGLYDGVPLCERGDTAPVLPDRIVLFRKPLCRAFPDEAALRRQVRITLLHEIAHHFGFDEQTLRDLGYG